MQPSSGLTGVSSRHKPWQHSATATRRQMAKRAGSVSNGNKQKLNQRQALQDFQVMQCRHLIQAALLPPRTSLGPVFNRNGRLIGGKGQAEVDWAKEASTVRAREPTGPPSDAKIEKKIRFHMEILKRNTMPHDNVEKNHYFA